MYKPRFRRSMRPIFNRDPHGKGLHASMWRSDDQVLPGSCVALVDARFLGWLLGAEHGSGQATGQLMPSQDLFAQLRGLLLEAGVSGSLLRVYWYTDKQPTQLVDHVVVRTVADATQDSGLGMVRAMSDDLTQLARSHAAEHVLLASDDERLWAAVDQAQLSGLCLHMLCDDSVSNFAQLQQDDPTWARLLAQADRRVVWRGGVDKSVVARTVEGAVDTREDAASILAQIDQWWSEEPEDQRDELRDELRQSRSIPQELDRQLLLRVSRELGRPLSWPDKKVMREGLRRTVLGEANVPASNSEPEYALS